MNFLTEATIEVLSTSATFNRDFAVDPTPYLRSGRNNWIPATTPPSAEQLQKRKEQIEDIKKQEAKSTAKPEVKTEAITSNASIATILPESENKSRTLKPKDKE